MGTVFLFSACVLTTVRAQTPTLVWGDEFDLPAGSGPDTTSWNFDLGRGNPPGWGNNELETYTNNSANVEVVNDADALDGRALAIRAQYLDATYTSARLQTAGKRTFTYGRMEARLKMPRGRGLWPAFWALGSNVGTAGWPACGEIDAMEWVGPAMGNGTILGSLHAPGYSGANPLSSGYTLPDEASFSDAYHVFAADRYPDRIVFSVDGIVYGVQLKSEIPTDSQWPFDQPFYLILNLAIGGNWPGSPDETTEFPQEYRIDYVRIYELPTTPPAELVYPPGTPTDLEAGNSLPGRIQLSWQAPADTFGASITGYRIERSTDPAFAHDVLVRNVGSATEFTDKGLQADRTYYFRLAAVSANGTSEYSSTTSAQLTVSTPVSAEETRLVNLSTRAYVGIGDNVPIVGFAISGTDTKRMLVRGIGPSLTAFNVTNPVPDPVLTLYDQESGFSIAGNDDWGTDGNAEIVRSSEIASGAFDLATGSVDAALVVDLPPGVYTAVINGKGGATGVALVEAYEVPDSVSLAVASRRHIR